MRLRAVLAFVQIIGACAFLRLFVAQKLSGQQRPAHDASLHTYCRAMAVNIDKIMKIMDTTFGTGIMT